ncbi:MAG: translation initiation factor IF-1 [Candidatus Tagabacteria bacterium]
MPESKEKGKIILGTAIEALPNATFKVLLEDGKEILANLAGKMRLYRIKVFVGNKVRVELNPYDEGKGRIIQRL